VISFGTYFVHPEASVGENVSIGAYCVIGRARIGRQTQIASHVQITSGRQQHTSGKEAFEEVVIGPECWIGASAVVMASVGPGTIVGAGAIVTKALPAGVTAVGNPARPLKQSDGDGVGAENAVS
jgi:acetyltransferase-like isoleucine patch superfamily enzyme